MSFMSWDASYSVGIDKIDEQHQKIIELLNSLHKAIMERDSKTVLADILNELKEYADYHFKVEEGYFAEFGYIGAESHKKEHEMFASKVMSYIEENKKGELLTSLKVLNFLSYWLINHIGESDKKYSIFLKGKGIK